MPGFRRRAPSPMILGPGLRRDERGGMLRPNWGGPAMRIVNTSALCVLLLGAAASPCLAQPAGSAGGRIAPGAALSAPSTAAEIAAGRPDPRAPGFRLPLPPLSEMEPAMREAF